jgi:hypothetical protein
MKHHPHPTTRQAIEIGLAPEEYTEASREGALRVLAGWSKRELAHKDRLQAQERELERRNDEHHPGWRV